MWIKAGGATVKTPDSELNATSKFDSQTIGTITLTSDIESGLLICTQGKDNTVGYKNTLSGGSGEASKIFTDLVNYNGYYGIAEIWKLSNYKSGEVLTLTHGNASGMIINVIKLIRNI